MMDYHAFWQAIVVVFGVVPLVVGAGLGAAWAWRGGRRGTRLMLPTVVGGAVLGLGVFAGAILFLRA